MKLIPLVDLYLFEQQFRRFKDYVYNQSGFELISFSANPFTEREEGYKYNVYRIARKTLDFENWKKNDVGKGYISQSLLKSIEFKENNLVQWQAKYGEQARPQQPLYNILENKRQLHNAEQVFFDLYIGVNDRVSFEKVINIFGKRYDLVAYLFFIKDRARYLPIAPSYFDKAFRSLGINFATARKCSWENYSTYVHIISEIKELLSGKMQSDVSLLDAHSFTWMLATLLADQAFSNSTDYATMSDKDRDAVIRARLGQGRFRNSLLNYWTECAITGCREQSLLIASHIKPWSECNPKEAIDLFNGILLSPTIDAAFDAGFITFSDTGEILISRELSSSDAKALGISSSLKLSKIESRHSHYLDYHRTHIFKHKKAS